MTGNPSGKSAANLESRLRCGGGMIIMQIFERGCAQQYSPDQPRDPRFAHDSLLEEAGFELLVPLPSRTCAEPYSRR
jgi:hypothetical protein